MDEIKTNDYFAARLLNSQETPGTLVTGGITADNTKLEDKEFYQNKAKVKEIFSDEDGTFQQEKFDEFYKQISDEFLYLNALRDQNFAFDFYEKNNANYRVTVGRKSNPQVSTELIANPTHGSLGLISGNTWSKQTESNRELAQQNQIFDTEEGKWTGETLNDLGAIGVLFGDPLVYATWDEEGTHIDPMTGEEKFHQKGEWKTDQFGNYYAETASKKSENLDKQFVKISDVLTDDNSAWNTVDIFDSDNIEASPIKSTIRTALVIGSTFIPYANVGSIIKYGTAALEFVKAIPNVAKMLNGFINDDTPEWLNHFDNTMARFDKSVNDETAQKGFWAYENIMDLVQTSYMQLVQQQAIANIPSLLFKYEDEVANLMKAAEKSTYYAKKYHKYEQYAKASQQFKAAEDLMKGANQMSDVISKVYLVTTAMTDSFDTARRSGLSQETASYVSLLSMAGMYGLLQTDYMRGLLTNSKDYEMLRDMKLYTTELAKQNIKHLQSQGLASVAESSMNNATKTAWYKSIGKSVSNFWKNHITSVKSGKFSIKEGMLAEGLEELSEEVMQDSATMLSRGLQMFKSTLTGKEYEDEYSWAKTNPLMRYTSAFVGGAIGGGIFTTANKYIFQKDAFKNFNDTIGSRSALNKQMVEYILAGKTQELLTTLDSAKQDMLSSTIDMDGNPTSDASKSQKEVVFNMMKSAIIAMDTFINTNSLGFSKDDFKIHTLIRAGWIKDNSIYDIMMDDYVDRVSKLSQLEAQRQSLVHSLDSASDSEKSSINSEIKKLDEIIKLKKQEAEDVKNGSVEEYMGAIMLKANRAVLEGLVPTTKDDFAELEFSMKYDELPKYAKEQIDAKMKALDEGGNLDLSIFKAWRWYKSLNINEKIKETVSKFNTSVGDSDLEQMTPELLLLSDVIEHSHYGDSPIFESWDSDIQLQQRKDALARLLLHRKATVSSSVFEGLDMDVEITNQLLDPNKVVQYFAELEQKVKSAIEFMNEYVKNPELLKSKSGEELSEIFGLYNTYETFENYQEIANRIKKLLEDSEYTITPDIDSDGNYTLQGMLKEIDTSEIESVLNAVLEEIGIKNAIPYIKNLIEYYRLDSNKFVLSADQIDILEKIETVLGVAQSLVLGADQKADNEVITGANALVLEALKEKGKKGDLLLISSDTTMVLNDHIDYLKKLAGFLLDKNRINQGGLINIDKINSNKRLRNKAEAWKNLIQSIRSGGENIWGTWAVSLPELPEFTDSETSSEEGLKQQNIELRSAILSFENWFKLKWDQCDEGSKKDFVSKILKYYFSPKGADDLIFTSSLETVATTFNDVDFVKYLWMVCAYDSITIANMYFEGFSSSEKCPFDSQEEVITSAAKMLLSNNKDMKIWAEQITSKLKEENTEENVVGVIYSFLCSFGVGGSGKSDVIIPEIIRIVTNIEKDVKIVIAVNTDTQRTEMTARFEAIYGEGKVEEHLKIILHSELESHMKHALSNSENVRYIIDECTNLKPETLLELQSLIDEKDSQIKAVMFGDDTQTGVYSVKPINDKDGVITKINQIIMPTTLSQSTPVRTVTDIARKNTQTLGNHFRHNLAGVRYFETSTLGNDDYFKYFVAENGELHGIMKDEKLGENIDAYIQPFLADGKTVLIFTKNETEYDALSEKYKAIPNVFVHKSIAAIQGSQWDYVINLWDQSLDDSFVPDKTKITVTDTEGNSTTKEVGIINSENERLNELGEQINTLFTRAKFGTISVPGTEWDWETHQSEYLPIAIGLTPEAVSSYKTFKTDVFKNVYGVVPTVEDPDSGEDDDAEGGDDGDGGSPTPGGNPKPATKPTLETQLEQAEKREKSKVKTEEKNIRRVDTRQKQGKRTSSSIPNIASECEFSAAWVPKHDYDSSVWKALGFRKEEDYAKWRSLIITLFVEDNPAKRQALIEGMEKISKIKLGEFGLFRYKEGFKENDLLPFGNAGKSASGKDVTANAQTWLVFKVKDSSGNDVLLHIAFCHTEQATKEYGVGQTPLNKQIQSIPLETYVPLPDYVKYHRNTSFDVKPVRTGTTEKEIKSSDKQTESKLFVTNSPIILMSKKQSLDQQICALSIINNLNTLGQEYLTLFTELQKMFGPNLVNMPHKVAMTLRNYIQRSFDSKGKPQYRVKGVPDVADRFCQFKTLYTGKPLSAETASTKYAAQLSSRIALVKDLINYIQSNPGVSTEDLIVKTESLGSPQEEVTIVVYENGNKTNDKGVISDILKKTNGKSGIASYRRAVHTQIVRMLCRIEQILCCDPKHHKPEYSESIKKLRELCNKHGINLEHNSPDWGRTIGELSVSSVIWGSYFNLSDFALDTANKKWIWSEDSWVGFIAEIYSNEEVMELLQSGKGFRLSPYMEEDRKDLKRNLDIRIHGALIKENKVLLPNDNSVFSTSHGQFKLEGQFLQVARLCIYGEPALLDITSTEENSGKNPTPSPKHVKKAWDLKTSVEELCNSLDAIQFKAKVVEYIENLGFTTKSTFESNKEMIEDYIENLKQEATQNCDTPPF